MFERIYNILVTILGQSKQGYYDSSLDQYQFNCVFDCKADNGDEPDGKYNLEINFGLGKFHCWKCDSKGKISYLIKKTGNHDLLQRYYEEVKYLKESKLYDLKLFSDIESILDDTDETLTLPKTFKKINLHEIRNTRLIDYLHKRKITQDIIDRYNIGYTSNDEEKPSLRNRIIIPSYNSYGTLNYWVGRDFTENDKRMKYWNSKNNKMDIIFQESMIQYDADIYLVEGALDCIYGDGNVISLLGKTLQKESKLFEKLKERANANIIICLDSDTDISETKRIYSLLNQGRLKNHIRYIRMNNDKDFGEAYERDGRNGIINLMRQQKDFKEWELVF